MRVTFLQAPLGRPEPLVYPLGIATLAGTLPKQMEIQILDPNALGMETAGKVLKEFAPDVICLSIRNLDSQIRRDLFYYYLYLKTVIRNIRSLVPDALLIAGGSGFSLFPERIMNENRDINLGVYLEADETLPRLLDNLDNPGSTPGVYYYDNDVLCFSGIPTLPSAEAFGKPRYDLLDPKPYETNGGVGLQTKRGCPLSCIYCTYPHLNGSSLRMLPITRIIDELRTLTQEYGVQEITFVDGVFNLPRSRTIEMLNAIKQAGLTVRWRGWFTEKGFDRELAELCRDTGCPEFSFSPDGFNDVSLKALGKYITVEDIYRVYHVAEATPGIRVAFNFFWNPPGQTLGTWLRMMVFALRCKLLLREKAGGIIFGNARIEPHTPLRQLAIDDGIISEDTDLLPATRQALEKTFYSNPSTRLLDLFYAIYTGLWRIKNLLRKK